MWTNRLTELLGTSYPIIQGGLAHLGFSELAAAVSNAGGLGQIGTVASFPDAEALRQDIRVARRLTSAPFGVNFSIRKDVPWQEYMDVVIEERVPVISITGGDPSPMLAYTAGKSIVRMVLVAGVRQAVRAEQLGADVVVVVGTEGGGHIGRDDTTTLALVPNVVDAVKVPVIASGGIGDARGVLAGLALGADGVEMGTRFVATQECRAHAQYKQAIVNAAVGDTAVIERSIGRGGRALRAPGAERILAAEARGAGVEELLAMIAGDVNKRAVWHGDLENGFAWAGQSVGVIHDVPTVAELMSRLIAEAETQASRLYQLTHAEAVLQPGARR